MLTWICVVNWSSSELNILDLLFVKTEWWSGIERDFSSYFVGEGKEKVLNTYSVPGIVISFNS